MILYFQHKITAIVAAVPLVAGLSLWALIGQCCDLWYETHRRRSRLEPPIRWGEAIAIGLFTFALVLAAHYASVSVLRAFNREAKILGLSGHGWRILFGCAYVLGSLLGSTLVFGKH